MWPTCVMLHNVSDQRRAGSDLMLKAYVLNTVLNFLKQSQSYCESSCFLLKERTIKLKNSLFALVFNEKHADNIGL